MLSVEEDHGDLNQIHFTGCKGVYKWMKHFACLFMLIVKRVNNAVANNPFKVLNVVWWNHMSRGNVFYVVLPLSTKRLPQPKLQDVFIFSGSHAGSALCIWPTFISWKYKLVPYHVLFVPLLHLLRNWRSSNTFMNTALLFCRLHTAMQ